VETSGHASWDTLRRLCQHVDLFLYDIKETDADRHRRCTGVPNQLLMENLRRLDGTGAHIIIRLPIIPGCNDRDDHFESVARCVTGLSSKPCVEILPYHRLGDSKRQRFGMEEREDTSFRVPEDSQINSWIDKLESCGVTVLTERRQSQ